MFYINNNTFIICKTLFTNCPHLTSYLFKEKAKLTREL